MMDDPVENILSTRVKIRRLNEMLCCKLCRGYFIDPTTVTECLHTFCKTCVVKKLENSNRCPECNEVVHNTRPLDFIHHDRTMQDLVNKIVPNLEENEYQREVKYYKDKGMPCPKEERKQRKQKQDREEKRKEEEEANANTEADNFNLEDYHRYDEQMNILLECKVDDENSNLKTITLLKKKLPSKYLRCSSMATVLNVKNFIVNEFLRSMEDYIDVEILCNNKPINKDHNLKFVYATCWPTKHLPLRLQYVPKETYTVLKPPNSETDKNTFRNSTMKEDMEINDDQYNTNNTSSIVRNSKESNLEISTKQKVKRTTSDTSSMESESEARSPVHGSSSEDTTDFNNNNNHFDEPYKNLKTHEVIAT